MSDSHTFRETFISEGQPIEIPMTFRPSWVKVTNITKRLNPGTTSRAFYSEWQDTETLTTSTLQLSKSSSTTTPSESVITTGGITIRDPSSVQFEAPVTFTSLSKATSAVVARSSHGLVVGDKIRLLTAASATQFTLMNYTVTARTANNFTLGYLDTDSLSANGGSGTYQKINFDDPTRPSMHYVTKLTKSAGNRTLTITTGDIHDFSEKQLIRFNGFDDYGIADINDMIGTVTAVNTTNNTMTVRIPTPLSGTFTFPAAASVGGQRPHVYPKGQIDTTTFDTAFERRSTIMIILGTSVSGTNNNNDELLVEAGLTI